MCFFRKQILNVIALFLGFITLICGPVVAQSGARGVDYSQNKIKTPNLIMTESAGSITAGVSHGGVISKLYVTAPPGWMFQVDRAPGSFVDCGEGHEIRISDENGRASANLSCGVTITETLVIPAASQSARLVVHY